MSIEEYSLLKIIALEWSLGNPPPPRIRSLLMEKYGVRTLVELDGVIHSIHRRLLVGGARGGIRASDDGLVLVGLLQALGHKVLSAKGDGLRKPLLAELEHVTVAVRLGATRAELGFNLDNPLDEVDYVLKYYEGIGDVIAGIETRVRGDTIEVHIDNPNIVEYAAGRLEALGLEKVGERQAGPEYIYYFKLRGDPGEAERVLKEIIAAYTVIAAEEIPYPYKPDSEAKVKEYIERLKRVLPVEVSSYKISFNGVHLHPEASRIDVHVTGRLLLRGGYGSLLPVLAAIIAGLDYNFETGGVEHALMEARRVVEEIDGITGFSVRMARRGLKAGV